MSVKIKVGMTVLVSSGPNLSLQREMEVDAYDSIEATIKAGATDVKIGLQPGELKEIQLLLVTADPYDSKVTYTVDDGAAAAAPASSAVALDQPHLLLGGGAVGLLGKAPKALHFGNTTAKDVTVRVLVGRKATA
ncbi:MAG: hypothetical protein HY270_18480 [Deltaproteobacteria bacterium]|nr:hypothetical protein [Deltaproteobacteria bacterium]